MSHRRRRRRRSRGARRDSDLIRQLRLINRRQREFLAVVGHELRMPLVGILGGIELLGRDGAEALGRRAILLDVIETSATHLRDLLSDVLDLSSAAAGRMQVALQPVSVAQVCSQAMQLVGAMALAKRIAIDIDIDASLDCVRADPRRLRQILSNVLNNAVKFTPEAGSVGVRARRDGNYATFEVWDDGPGLRPEELTRLSAFEPYTRLMSAPDTPAGTGLGLAIAKQLVDLHAGKLSIQSTLGRGSRFRIDIPLAAIDDISDQPDAAATGEARNSADQQAATAMGMRVLLIDDVASNLVIATTYLRQVGFEVITADSALRALDILRHTPVDVVVCDIRMPDMDGVAFTRLIRCDPSFATLPIIALTGSSHGLDRRQCLAAGMQDLLLKPLALRELARSVARHCRPRPDADLRATSATAAFEQNDDECAAQSTTARILHDINDALGAAIGNLDLVLNAEEACDRAMLRDAFGSCRRVAALLLGLHAAMAAGADAIACEVHPIVPP